MSIAWRRSSQRMSISWRRDSIDNMRASSPAVAWLIPATITAAAARTPTSIPRRSRTFASQNRAGPGRACPVPAGSFNSFDSLAIPGPPGLCNAAGSYYSLRAARNHSTPRTLPKPSHRVVSIVRPNAAGMQAMAATWRSERCVRASGAGAAGSRSSYASPTGAAAATEPRLRSARAREGRSPSSPDANRMKRAFSGGSRSVSANPVSRRCRTGVHGLVNR